MTEIHELMSKLHQLQVQLGDLGGRLRRLPQVLKVQETNVAKQIEKLNQVRAEQQKLLLEAKAKEKEMLTNEQSLAKRRLQLSEAKTNKEFLALKQQIAADEAANSVLADEAIESMEKSESFVSNVKEADAELHKVQDLFRLTQQQFALEEPVIQLDIKRITGILNDTERELPREFREYYDRLVRSHGGSEALAVIQNRKFCGGCNQQIAINIIAQVLQKKPVTCNACGRLLYVPENFVFDKG